MRRDISDYYGLWLLFKEKENDSLKDLFLYIFEVNYNN